MYDGPKLIPRPVSVLGHALRVFFRGPERTRSATSIASRKHRAEARRLEALTGQRQSVDAAIAAYVEWRATCTELRSAYSRWARAPAADAELAYLTFRAALDREQAAAEVYARLMRKVGHLVESGLDYPLSATFWAAEPE
jgi:hypothetical protein